IKSWSTVPGPTDGSWSTSPTRISPEQLGTARKSECISGTSTMEVSSTTRRPQASGLDSFRVKRPVPGSISSRRWIVFASKRVVSASRFAARPVGAHSRHFTPFVRRNHQDRVHKRRLAYTRSSGDNHDPVPENRLQRLALAGGERLARPPLAPRGRLV